MRAESHVYVWASGECVWTVTHLGGPPAYCLWAPTKRAWLATEKMWRVTHLAERPRQVYGSPRDWVEAHTRCVAYGHALRWPRIAWVDGRDVGMCGRALCERGHEWVPTRKGKSEPPQLHWGAGAVQVAMKWVYSFAITAPMSDLACLGSALPTWLAKSPLGKSELNTCSASEPRSQSARAVPLACL